MESYDQEQEAKNKVTPLSLYLPVSRHSKRHPRRGESSTQVNMITFFFAASKKPLYSSTNGLNLNLKYVMSSSTKSNSLNV